LFEDEAYAHVAVAEAVIELTRFSRRAVRGKLEKIPPTADV
jgi:hypothetical protein